MTDHRAAQLRLAFVLREIIHQRCMSLRVCRRPWWKPWQPYWWLEDSAGQRYTEWPW